MQRCDSQIGHVHRYLCNAILFDEPSNSLTCFKCSGYHYGLAILVFNDCSCYRITLAHWTAFLAHIKSNCIGATGGCGVQIIVYCNKKIACANGCCARTCNTFVVWACAKVGAFIFVCQLFGEAFIFSCATHRKVTALRLECCRFIAVCRYSEFIGETFCKYTCQFCALFHGDARNWNQRTYIACSHARMCSLVLSHVDEFGSAFYTCYCSVNNSLGFAHECHNSAVCCFAWVNIKQLYTLDSLNGIGNMFDNLHVAALREVGHALDNSFLHGIRLYVLLYLSQSNLSTVQVLHLLRFLIHLHLQE